MDKSDENTERERWERLIAWMQTKGFDASGLCVEPRIRKGAGQGLFVTRTLHPSKKPFLVIPASALLNIRTLSPIYSTIPLEGFTENDTTSDHLVLTGIQLLSIHLALYRPTGDSFSKDPHFGPYIDSLPRGFDSHPLTWSVKEKLGTAGPCELELLRNLPPSVVKELNEVANRFWNDWDVAVQAKAEYLAELKSRNEALFDLHDFLWGWLVVNTRCLYADIFEGRLPQSNLTLCPVIDFANHTSSSTLPRAEWKDAPKRNAPKHVQPRRRSKLLKGRDYVFVLPEQVVNEGEELFLKYGDHTNSTLFVEYGFVEESPNSSVVDVSDLVDGLIAKKNMATLIKQLLPEVASPFISDLRLYTSPPPSHASWYLHLVLRLINLEFPSSRHANPNPAEVEQFLQPWQDVIMGKAEFISDANETLVRHDLKSMCEVIMDRSSGAIKRLADKEGEESSIECGWYGWAKCCVAGLWGEEAQVARQVLDSLACGQAL